MEGLARDAFTRALTPAIAARLKPLAGEGAYAVTAATVAVEADAAAVVLVVSERRLERARCVRAGRCASWLGRGAVAIRPGPASRRSRPPRPRWSAPATRRASLAAAEIMEAFAVQAMACIDGIGLDRARVNRGGGALSRGHPIGASGAILTVRLWHELQCEAGASAGLVAIAAAGGLGSALVGEV